MRTRVAADTLADDPGFDALNHLLATVDPEELILLSEKDLRNKVVSRRRNALKDRRPRHHSVDHDLHDPGSLEPFQILALREGQQHSRKFAEKLTDEEKIAFTAFVERGKTGRRVALQPQRTVERTHRPLAPTRIVCQDTNLDINSATPSPDIAPCSRNHEDTASMSPRSTSNTR